MARRLDRRAFLRYAISGLGVAVAGGAIASLSGCDPHARDVGPDDAAEGLQRTGESPNLVLDMRARPDEVQILPGAKTKVWRYEARVLGGDAGSVQPLPSSYLGPLLRFRRGETVRITFTNELPEPTIIHWHGMHVPEHADGHPRLAIDPGESYTYTFRVMNRAGTYWYHPHPHGRTGPQVNAGLAGLIIVEGNEVSTTALPSGAYDVPLVIQDRAFSDDNQLMYAATMETRMLGFSGDTILVNGQPTYVLPVATRPYRLRLLNGSNARIYKLGWSDGRHLDVIATDGGLLERPVSRTTVTLAPGERVEVWVDFSQDPIGAAIILQNLSFAGGDTFPVVQANVVREEQAHAVLPEVLSDLGGYREIDAINREKPRSFTLEMSHMSWQLNGRTFDMHKVAPDEVVRLGDLEVWEFRNDSLRMAMPHPMHVHNVQFQVVGREVLPDFAAQNRGLAEGYVDEGWKDTVLLLPGERVKVLLKFESYEGLYLYHCHNLEHEDAGMMRNYRVQA
ncbi:MAG: multicopper oxidase domain-containing protein [Anaerolineae bacterium]|nr:multicopper oxidase domain-containing protein [Anaerolineae bacterium]